MNKMIEQVCIRLVLFCLGLIAGPTQALTKTVDVKDNSFQAATVHVNVGDSVQWIWKGSNSHSTTSGTCSGASCSLNAGQNWDSGIHSNSGYMFTQSPPFSAPGTYPYYCSVHFSQGMKGTVIVDAELPPPTCDASVPINQNPIPAAIEKDAVVSASLQEVAKGQGLVSPNWGTAAPGDKQHLFVVDTVGKLWAINLASLTKNLVLDISPFLVKNLGKVIDGLPGYDERGFLGLAFHPNYKRNRLFYTFTSEPYVPGIADFPLHNLLTGSMPDNLSVVSEWQVDDPKAAQPTVSGTRRVLMRIGHPEFNHNGGALNFGRDRMLYISTGDGGNANDQDGIGGHTPGIGNGQDLSTVLGKILRINPLAKTSANIQYGIPRSNPFAKRKSRGGDAGCTDDNHACDEIWAYGFRNPYRFSFDKRGSKLFAADVGQNKVEEIDWVKKGGNFGWAYKEGNFFFLPDGSDGSGVGFISDDSRCRSDVPAGLMDPIAQYDHDEGLAVVGGFVYRGKTIRSLIGHYVFGDYAKAFATQDPNSGGRLFHFSVGGLRGNSPAQRPISEIRLDQDASVGMSIFGFAQDANGELYVLGNTLGVPAPRDTQDNYLETGVIKKLVPVSVPTK